jgi:hypothetical protein
MAVGLDSLGPEDLARLQWQLSRWRDLYEGLVVAGLPPLTSEEEVELWATASSILTILANSWRGADPDNKIWELFHFVALGISSALKGVPPKAWRTVKGGRHQGDLVKSAKLHAAAYVRLSKEGLIPDKKYNKTICSLFGVDATAVQKWAKLDCSESPSENEVSRFMHLQGPERGAEWW